MGRPPPPLTSLKTETSVLYFLSVLDLWSLSHRLSEPETRTTLRILRLGVLPLTPYSVSWLYPRDLLPRVTWFHSVLSPLSHPRVTNPKSQSTHDRRRWIGFDGTGTLSTCPLPPMVHNVSSETVGPRLSPIFSGPFLHRTVRIFASETSVWRIQMVETENDRDT